ncbi:MAG: NfeD family protein [Oscillospiraceae bacterium]|nr:NfeD family protein [Oscillospiraceae bacterium]
MTIWWLAALVIFAVAEAVTVNLVSIWFAGGALVAMIAAGLNAPLWLQIVLFLVVSGLLLALVAPWARKASRVNSVATNADRHIGRQALVTEEINNLQESGAIRLDGVIWTARSESGEVIPAGTTITVKRIAGVKAYVEPAKVPAEV